MRLAILCATFNRREVTVEGLTHLIAALNRTNVDFEIFLLDDNSKDGTAQAVAEQFPEIHISHGTGNLYWNRGMCAAFKDSISFGSFDAYLLFNDDVIVEGTAVDGFLDCFRDLNHRGPSILVGATTSRSTGEVTYSAYIETSKIKALGFSQLRELGETVPCDTFNGNFVLIPGDFIRQTGGLDEKYHHGLGDIDFGLVAKRSGVPSYLYAVAVGYCEKGTSLSERIPASNFATRLKLLFGAPHGIGPYAHFVWKHRPRVLFPAYLTRALGNKLKSLVVVPK